MIVRLDASEHPAAAVEIQEEAEAALRVRAVEARRHSSRHDVAALSKLVNPYLLRFYFLMAGMPEDDFLRRIRSTGARNG